MEAKYEVVKYSKHFYDDWNDFVATSKNGTFLFHRDFMEYHQDRFEDYSLMVYRDKKLVSILPANVLKDKVYSHNGLSYGGLILQHKNSFKSTLESFSAILKFLSDQKKEKLYLKQLPKIYHLRPSDEMDYLLFLLNAIFYRKDLSMAISLNHKNKFSTLRKRKINKAIQHNLNIKQEADFSLFWNEVLTPNLNKKYGVDPIHSLEEITKLQKKFPNNIKQYNVYFDEDIMAGCTVFETETVAHLQYISTKKYKDIGALDFLIDKLINGIYKEKVYFDFGISNENGGKNVNLGLFKWKQSFGASPVIHDFYEIDTVNYQLLKSVFI